MLVKIVITPKVQEIKNYFKNMTTEIITLFKLRKRQRLKKIFGNAQILIIIISKSVASCIVKSRFLYYSFCQLSLWGAKVEPLSKETSCAFIVNQLASTLLGTTSNLTNAVGGTITGTLGGLGLNVASDKKRSEERVYPAKSGGVSKNTGLLGLF